MRMVPRMKFVVRVGFSGIAVILIVVFFSLTENERPDFLMKSHNGRRDDSAKKENGLGALASAARRGHLQVDYDTQLQTNEKLERRTEIVLAVVVCGERLNETLVMLKSAAIFTKAALHFIIFSDDENQPIFKQKLDAWPAQIRARVRYTLHPIQFPDVENAEEWKKLFKLCASQRLFLPDLLKDVDSLLYVDTDVLFLRSLEDIWHFFRLFNSSQMAAMTPEHEDYSTGWYNRFARHPYYKPLGVNSGVMLMNLTRLRAFQWQKYIVPIYKEYKLKITWGDQDIINIIFHYHPDKLFVYPCEWNFRPDHCMYMSVCKTAEQYGVSILHGNRGVFHNNMQPAFKAVYQALEKFPFNGDAVIWLLKPMKAALMQTTNTNCGKLHRTFTKYLEKVLDYKMK